MGTSAWRELLLSYFDSPINDPMKVHLASKSHVDITTIHFASRGRAYLPKYDLFFIIWGNIVLASNGLLARFPHGIAHVQ